MSTVSMSKQYETKENRIPEVVRLADSGKRQWEIAEEIGVSERRVRQLIQYAKQQGWIPATVATRSAAAKLDATIAALEAQQEKVSRALDATKLARSQLG